MIRIDGIIGEGRNTAEALAEQLSDGAIELVINSPGGDAFEGAAMLAELSAHAGPVTAHVRGIAASAASLIAMGADNILIDASAVMMIHDPSGVTIGPPAEHRRTADDLEKLAETYATAYARRSGNDPREVRSWMIAETWLDAAEAVALGFADRIEDSAPEMVARFDFTKFARAPAELVSVAQAQGWTALPSEHRPS